MLDRAVDLVLGALGLGLALVTVGFLLGLGLALALRFADAIAARFER